MNQTSTEQVKGPLMAQIEADLTLAMKARDRVRMDALRYVKSLLLQNKTSSAPIDELSVVISYVKKMQDSLVSFPEGSEIIDKTNAELTVIREYLPKPMTEEDFLSLVKTAKEKGVNNFSAMMKEITPQIKGKFDGKRAADLIKGLF